MIRRRSHRSRTAVSTLFAAAIIACLPARTTVALALLANDDAYSVVHDRTLVVPASGVLANDITLLGTSTAVRDSGPSHGVLTLRSDGGFAFSPNAGYVGSDSFQYHVHDTILGLPTNSNSATVAITITNTAPVARDDTYTATTGIQLTVAAPGVLRNDTDADGDSLTAQLVDGGGNGSLSLSSSGGFTFKSGGSFTGIQTFTYRASDGLLLSNLATVTITVSPAPTPTSPPTPAPTPAPTPPPPTATPVPTATPSATVAPSASPSTAPTAAPTASPGTTAAPTGTPGPGSPPDPSASTQPPGPGGSVTPSGAPPGGTALPSAGPRGPGSGPGPGTGGGTTVGGSSGGGGLSVPEIATDAGISISDLGLTFQLNPFAWLVPGFFLGLPGLLLILIVLAQMGTGATFLVLTRRSLGDFGFWRRRRHDDPTSTVAPGKAGRTW
jgi:Bacterial cadherin-like domain